MRLVNMKALSILGRRRIQRQLAALCALFAGLIVACRPALGHHGATGYDYTVPRKTLTGTITQYVRQNPHTVILLDVKDEAGKSVTWALELNNPGNMIELGWTHSSVKAGDQVTASFNPGKGGNPIGICVDLVLAGGRKLHSSQGCIQGSLKSFDELRQLDKDTQPKH